MNEILLLAVQIAAYAGIAAALVRPAWRALVAKILVALGATAAIVAAVTGLGVSRELEVFHWFAAYQGSDYVTTPFLVDTTRAAGHWWGLLILGAAVVWAAALWRLRPDGRPESNALGAGVHPFWAPVLLAWTGIGLSLGLEKLAAPAGFVTPGPFDRAILPAAIAACFLLAHRHRRVPLVLAWVALLVTFVRSPLIVVGTLATQNDWGTNLDVHTITLFANPVQQDTVEVVSHSSDQLAWLIWAPHALVMPSLYMLSLGSIAFAVTMFLLHPKTGTKPVPRPS